MHRKRDYLVGAAACLLCFLSGAINVHFVRLFGFAVGYLAGDLLRLFIEVGDASHEIAAAITLVSIILSFVAGAICAGYSIHHPRFSIERPYGRTLIAIGILFLGAASIESSQVRIALPLAAFASGLQNALATRYRGTILRTTHITGIVTDFGQSAGMRLAGNDIESWKIWLYLCLFLSFLLGIIAGLIFDAISGDRAAFIIAPIYIFFGATFVFFKRRFLGIDTPSHHR